MIQRQLFENAKILKGLPFISGAEAMVYLCPLCFQTLSGKARALEMKNYMVTDLCRLALGEKLPEDKPE